MQEEQPTATTSDGSRWNVGQIGILIIQGFAIFAAFSALLGRIYFREYANTLRIPESEFHLNAVDYSVISPDVAISGIGVAVFSIALVLSFKLRVEPAARWPILILGAVSLVTCFLIALQDLSNNEIPEPGAGAFGIWWLLLLSGWALGTALVISVGISWVSDSTTVDERPRSVGRPTRRPNARLPGDWVRVVAVACLAALGATAISLLLLAGLLQATIVGGMNAAITLREAPLVKVEFNSPSTIDILRESNLDDGKELRLPDLKLVHVGDKFVYLRRPEHSCICPADAKVVPGQPIQYAVPAGDIVTITYFE